MVLRHGCQEADLMTDDGDLHRPLYIAEVLANALNQGGNRPLLHLKDGPTLNVSEVRNATSQLAQALQSLGIGRGSRVALISPNRPECLHVTHAVQMLAAIYVPLHPLSGPRCPRLRSSACRMRNGATL
jgi:fatty-acyl-CoA synthase